MRYILSIVGVVAIIVLIIVIIIVSGPKTPPKPAINLSKYNYEGTSVSQTTDGPLVGEDQYKAIRITITQDSRTIYILSGYEQNISNSETFSNTPAAYAAFLQVLQINGFTNSRSTNETSILGTCPMGNTYIYELSNGYSDISSLWSTSCFLSDGNFDGHGSVIRQLFQGQITNYQAFTASVSDIIQ